MIALSCKGQTYYCQLMIEIAKQDATKVTQYKYPSKSLEEKDLYFARINITAVGWLTPTYKLMTFFQFFTFETEAA